MPGGCPKTGGEPSDPGPTVSDDHAARHDRLRLLRLRRRGAPLDGAVPRLRGVEHAQRGDARGRPRQGGAAARRAAVKPLRLADVKAQRYERLKTGDRRAGPDPGRRARAGLAGADRRLAGDRQVDADLDGARQPRGRGAAHAVRERGGVRGADPAARRAAARRGAAGAGAGRDRPGHGAGDARGRGARGLRDRLGADAARVGSERARRAPWARCARSRTGSRGWRRPRGSRCCSSAT